MFSSLLFKNRILIYVTYSLLSANTFNLGKSNISFSLGKELNNMKKYQYKKISEVHPYPYRLQ